MSRPRSAFARPNAVREIGGGWDPHGHTPSDVFTTYNEADFRLGLNAAQTTLSAVAQTHGRQGFAVKEG